MLLGISVVIPIAISQLDAYIRPDGTCSFTWTRGVFRTTAVAQVVPMFLFMVLFIIPCRKSQVNTSHSWTSTWKTYLGVGIFCTVVNITTLLLVNFIQLSDSSRIFILLPSEVFNNIMLVFLFSDWRLRVLPCLNHNAFILFRCNGSTQNLMDFEYSETLYAQTTDVFGSSKRVHKPSVGFCVEKPGSHEQEVKTDNYTPLF